MSVPTSSQFPTPRARKRNAAPNSLAPNINTIPRELIAHILTFLRCKTLCVSIQVCKTWRKCVDAVNKQPECFVGLSTTTSAVKALREAMSQCKFRAKPNIVVLFYTAHYTDVAEMQDELATYFPADTRIIGACSFGIIGTRPDNVSEEHLDTYGLSIYVANNPGAEVSTFCTSSQLPSDMLTKCAREGWSSNVVVISTLSQWDETNEFVEQLQLSSPSTPIVGGFVGVEAEENSLFAMQNGEMTSTNDGVIGLLVNQKRDKAVAISSRGWECRGTYKIIKAADLVVQQLEDPETHVMYEDSPPPGIASYAAISVEEGDATFEHGYICVRFDFVFGLMCIKKLWEEIPPGTLNNHYIKFYVLSPEQSVNDLDIKLAKARRELPNVTGGLLFCCAARGEHFYGKKDVDPHAFNRAFGSVPLAGMFCGGEIGPRDRFGVQTEGSKIVQYTSTFGLYSAQQDV